MTEDLLSFMKENKLKDHQLFSECAKRPSIRLAGKVPTNSERRAA